MKALSLWQPWATLMEEQYKKVETRCEWQAAWDWLEKRSPRVTRRLVAESEAARVHDAEGR